MKRILYSGSVHDQAEKDAVMRVLDGGVSSFAIGDRHELLVVEDSCDALGATLRGTPTGSRSDISLTSFANSHIITCAGNGGMVVLDDQNLRDRGLLLRRWGRRSEVQLYGTRTGERDFWEEVDGIR